MYYVGFQNKGHCRVKIGWEERKAKLSLIFDDTNECGDDKNTNQYLSSRFATKRIASGIVES